ncbi:hypothetical protein BbINS_00940 [Bartonella bacilliformis INS]|uniref:Uncharacterized protein n=2 Tax=Bartonella bacilliformis TaxID=774 RepID=A1URD1_BARBK|nr:hypothetical protein BARBAKC583_0197 [Bartonella bacilliformis KC583]EKS46084.1 hypothetical protein BbINS_00940 [Bartonella bacilliformis INS]
MKEQLCADLSAGRELNGESLREPVSQTSLQRRLKACEESGDEVWHGV